MRVAASAISVVDARKKTASVEIPLSALKGMGAVPSQDDLARADAAKKLEEALGGAEPGAFRVALWVDGGKKVFRPNDRLVLWFKAMRDCYLAVYSRDCQGKVRCIFPWQGVPSDTFVKAGKPYRIPPQEAGYEIVPILPYGTEVVQAVASTQPIEPLVRPRGLYPSNRGFDEHMLRGFQAAPRAERAVATLILTTTAGND